MKHKKCTAVLDIGGTHIRLGFFSATSKLIWMGKKAVSGPRAANDIITFIADWILEKSQELSIEVQSIGAGVPGIVDSLKGLVYSSPHYAQWHKVSFASLLSRRLKLPVVIDNDANIIARGELTHGAGKKLNSFIMLTLGTGIGGALVIDKKIFQGDCGFAGEIGHMALESNGPSCACGSQGCFETFVSHTALKRILRQKIKKKEINKAILTQPEAEWGRIARQKALLSEPGYRPLFETMGIYLGRGIASVANVTGIFNFVVGGGMAPLLPLMRKTMNQEIKKRIYRQSATLIKVQKATLGDFAGLVGSLDLIKSIKGK